MFGRDIPRRVWWWVGGLTAALGIAVVAFRFAPATGAEKVDRVPTADRAVPVEVVRPHSEGIERTTTQPGTVQAFEQARIFAAASGYLKTLNVDIGDRVKRGQVLAVIDVPELELQVKEAKALLDRAKARLWQMRARVTTSEAELETAKAAIAHAEASAKSTQAMRRFRQKQLRRMQDLFALKSIDERLVDESQEHYEAALEAERAAAAAIGTFKAQKETAQAKIHQADADVEEAEADIEVVRVRLEKFQVMVDFATVRAPYDGIVTQRSLLPGDYVRGATESTAGPLLTVERTDRMRVVVQVPDRDVPFTDPGDPADVEIDALPGKHFKGKVSRIAGSEDPQTRLMRIEIDLPNPKGEIRQGMYGRANILLDRPRNQVVVPSSCLVGKTDGGKGRVYVVREGKAVLVEVVLESDDGVRAALSGPVSVEEDVVLHPAKELKDGVKVVPFTADGVRSAD